jgi:hypothetical protein
MMTLKEIQGFQSKGKGRFYNVLFYFYSLPVSIYNLILLCQIKTDCQKEQKSVINKRYEITS